IDGNPAQRALGVAVLQFAVPAVDAEDETEPVFAILAETGPTDRAAKDEFVALDAGFFPDLAAHARQHIFASFQLSSEPVVLSRVMVIGPSRAVDQQYALAVRRHHVAECADDGREGHGFTRRLAVQVRRAGHAFPR